METWRMIHLATLRYALAAGLNYIITPACEYISAYRELPVEVESLSSHRPLLAGMRSLSDWSQSMAGKDNSTILFPYITDLYWPFIH